MPNIIYPHNILPMLYHGTSKTKIMGLIPREYKKLSNVYLEITVS